MPQLEKADPTVIVTRLNILVKGEAKHLIYKTTTSPVRETTVSEAVKPSLKVPKRFGE